MKLLSEKDIDRIAEQIAKNILEQGLKRSTWADTYPEAYKELLHYREDITNEIEEGIGSISLVFKKF